MSVTENSTLSTYAARIATGKPVCPSQVINVAGPAGNYWALSGAVANILGQLGIDEAGIDEVMNDMKSGDYDHVVAVASRWVTIIGHVPDQG